MACGSSCCGPPPDPAATSGSAAPPAADPALSTRASTADNASDRAVHNASTEITEIQQQDVDVHSTMAAEVQSIEINERRSPFTTEASVQLLTNPVGTQSEGCQKGCCGLKIEEPPKDDCGKGCCGPKIEPPEDDCGKGCCGSSPEQPPKDITCGKGCCESSTISKPIQVQGKSDCKAGCCSSTAVGLKDFPQKEDCCDVDTEPAEDACKDACCSEKPPLKDDCCASDLESSDDACKSDCCSEKLPLEEDITPKPDCCAGKIAPCCSTSCIDRIALRECEAGDDCGSCSDTSQAKTGVAKQGGKACRTHLRRAYDRYQAQLDAIGCICRALLALGKESCCAPQGRSKGARSVSRLSARSFSGSRSSLVSTRSKAKSCAEPCCGPKRVKTKEKTSSKATCGRPGSVSITVDSCADGCCGDEKAPNSHDNIQLARNDGDPERRGMSGQEHVVLAITGMTCTGCETKLQRTMSTLQGVSNLKTSLVLARAELDIDLRMLSVSEVTKHLERTTEFKCERLTSHGSSLDLLCVGDPRDVVDQKWPDGVTGVRAIDRKKIRVDFDPKIIGARDLVNKGWGSPMNLAPPQPDQTLNAGAKHVRHVGLLTLLSAVLTIPVLVMAWAPLPEHEIAYGSASLALATLVQVLIAGPFYPKALKAMVFSRVIEMDLLIVLSTSAAYIFSVVSFGYLVAGQPLSTGEFFETSTLLITLIMVGRYAAALARQKAVESISIRSLQTTTATVFENNNTTQIDARLLQFGDVFMVAPDSAVPTDGVVLSGSTDVDESMMTGESTPVEKNTGSIVIAGSVNGPGTIKVRLTRLPDDNTISTIAGMVDEAKLSKPKIQEMADRIATYFVPVVVALTIITFSIWVAIGVAVQNRSGSDAVIQAVTYGITVLIVSCPCAIGLAVPMVVVIATGVAAERGVIFKSSESIELACKTSHVVFDKTGTLTQGKLSVVREEYLADEPELAKSLLLALVEHVKHPVSVAAANHLKALGVTAASGVSETKVQAGKGIEGKYLGASICAGNATWLDLSSNAHVQSIQSQARTAFCFVVGGSPAVVFGLQDSLRPDAAATVSKLQDSGITVHLLSGDDDGAVQAAGLALGIPDMNIRSRCSPGDKQVYIKELIDVPPASQQAKSNPPVVVFCGDGTNDAAALAQATIGIHINEGTDVAKSAADVVLMRPNLNGILTVISVSKKAVHRIAFNFGWSFVYNLFAILLSAGAFVNARIPPAYAGLGELVSVLPVIAAALLLRWTKV
ncbi:copper-translocating P-type ATPase [Thelonectria olida]|uniref:Copper-translocating P-type ATPase n=1 Tax=Thelonectria olida TaxID=1576542 RepID=A0A9P9AUK9_9HYPO|nr:copper-translocating P-type ATPase [Thelonectria olida]